MTNIEPALISSAYFPPISYFVYLQLYNCKLDIHENFIKQSYRNRCEILGANGVLPLIVPIQHNGERQMKNIAISYAENWQKNHWKSIQSAYQRSPYFEFYEDKLQAIFTEKYSLLVELNQAILEKFVSLLQITINLEAVSSYNKNFSGLDMRFTKKTENPSSISLPTYSQVFNDRFKFQQNLSILDLMCNLGPQSATYIQTIIKNHTI